MRHSLMCILLTAFSIGAQADVNARDFIGHTALMRAASHGDLEAVRSLVGAQADVKARAANGDTALFLARRNGHQVVADLLIKAGAVE